MSEDHLQDHNTSTPERTTGGVGAASFGGNTLGPLLVWGDDLASGHAAMDRMHEEFVTLANALVLADDEHLLPQLRAFEQHAQAHFADEDQQMRALPYPSAGCHLDEHAAVLKSLSEVLTLLEGGNVRIARELADELIRWFPGHTEEMDKSFVRWRAMQQHGGAPVRFERNRRRVG